MRYFITSILLLGVARGTEAASTLFQGGTVIGFDNKTETPKPLYNTSILVTGDTITAIFNDNKKDSVEIPLGTEIVPCADLIISPGFIDTHRHTWQTTYRTIASNITLSEYFVRYSPLSRVPDLFTPQDFYLSQVVGLWEALNAGVTSLLDHSHNINSRQVAEAALTAYLDSGARVWFGYGFDPTGNFTIPERAAHVRELALDQRLSTGLVQMGMAFDTWTGVDEPSLEAVLDLLKTGNLSVLTTHWLDGQWNIRHSPSLFQGLGILNQSFPIVFSHGTFITPAEYQLLKEHNHYVSITPESEMHFGHTNQESDLIMDQAALGVDTHATYSGDIVTQARMWLQSVRLRSFRKTLDEWKIPRYSPMSVNQAFHLATRAGAQALRRPDLGILQVGAKADIVTFDGKSANMVGWRDPVAAIILHSNVGDVRDVMIGGSFVKRNGNLVAENLANVTARFQQSSARIQEEAVKIPYEMKGGFVFNPVLPSGVVEPVDAVRGDRTGY
ncbi:uncharacterized protein NECHADRAFT_44083 [Fusarium vanettenii 77-13-4]|uniref:Amidohydrolase-related domain-containing protein n=1 Tax=Fusarium vanettenii (strain ATCC MYA-4622 / CBS 123669 / FGSC 9596 / NRRL 45880 / 77-13-4) TaxID=660122 RepID=C7ZA15_FUSV7|nr:uncharacterized protein NECHADRAFT_44083 [Fusarium vanettenii 77-13-4]EEU39195.1 hypothetical protein NECHADRAFT_44083 [Fusarium vanettenii 77-13-4]